MLWVIRAANKNSEDSMISEQVVGLPWSELGTLLQYQDKEALKERYRKSFPGAPPGRANVHVALLHAFSKDVTMGDLVLLPLGTRKSFAVGMITGPYEFRECQDSSSLELSHVRQVKWLSLDLARSAFPEDLLDSLRAGQSFYRVDRNQAEARIHLLIADSLES